MTSENNNYKSSHGLIGKPNVTVWIINTHGPGHATSIGGKVCNIWCTPTGKHRERLLRKGFLDKIKMVHVKILHMRAV